MKLINKMCFLKQKVVVHFTALFSIFLNKHNFGNTCRHQAYLFYFDAQTSADPDYFKTPKIGNTHIYHILII